VAWLPPALGFCWAEPSFDYSTNRCRTCISAFRGTRQRDRKRVSGGPYFSSPRSHCITFPTGLLLVWPLAA
jgi:hypothetical protein